MEIIVLDGESPLLEAYLPFIVTSYCKTLRASSNYFSAMPTDLFFPKARDNLMSRLEDSSVTLLVDSDDLNVIIGYSIYNDKKVDIVFIKRVFRGKGLSRRITPVGVKHHTMFMNRNNLKIFKKYNFSFNPYL